jgi:hypothetical protein
MASTHDGQPCHRGIDKSSSGSEALGHFEAANTKIADCGPFVTRISFGEFEQLPQGLPQANEQ